MSFGSAAVARAISCFSLAVFSPTTTVVTSATFVSRRRWTSSSLCRHRIPPSLYRTVAGDASTPLLTAAFGRSSSTARLSMSTETEVDVAANLKAVEERIQAAEEKVGSTNVNLVAVSKTKPIELLDAAYEANCRCFGENYVQELVEKISLWKDTKPDVQWHFIGGLQSNKCNALVKAVAYDVSRLTVETVASTKLANKLNNAVSNLEGTDYKCLKVFVQVNTSGEESKSGVAPGQECVDLCLHIAKECNKLELCGLMTIGAVGDLSCFKSLKACREEVTAAFSKAGIERSAPLGLSMGMSGDFEDAIVAGATNVRVGSTIFGARDYSNK